MSHLSRFLILLILLLLQIAWPAGLDLSLCGLLLLTVRSPAQNVPAGAVALGLIRDAFSAVPLGAQALGLGITVVVVRTFLGFVFFDSFWMQGLLFFIGYVLYTIVFFGIGSAFGFLKCGFWDGFVGMLPKALLAVAFCWMLGLLLSRLGFFRRFSEHS